MGINIFQVFLGSEIIVTNHSLLVPANWCLLSIIIAVWDAAGMPAELWGQGGWLSNRIVQRRWQVRHERELPTVPPGAQKYMVRLEGEGAACSPDPGIAQSPLLMGVANAD